MHNVIVSILENNALSSIKNILEKLKTSKLNKTV